MQYMFVGCEFQYACMSLQYSEHIDQFTNYTAVETCKEKHGNLCILPTAKPRNCPARTRRYAITKVRILAAPTGTKDAVSNAK